MNARAAAEPGIGVVIPCHRQERFLPRTIAAAERALAGRRWQGVVVMASGGAAPEVAAPWRVLQPPSAAVRTLTPGAARMLGFSECGGDWVLFLDADVELDADWLREALAVAAREPALAGLWGRLEEWFQDATGERAGSPDMYKVGDRERRVGYLATLAFYRREALVAAGGYDPRLSSEEDFELGLRFAQVGLELRSLGGRAGRHWSAPRPSFAELARRWRTGLCLGQGQVLRIYAGRPGFTALLRRQMLYIGTLAMWAAGLVAAALALVRQDVRPLALWTLAPLAVLLIMTARKRSPRLAMLSLLTWTTHGAGLLAGLARGTGGPARPVAAHGEAHGALERGQAAQGRGA
jgi:hypothetical protein